ncbi:hypothetical protein ABIB90_001545 [Bradyrhizobium sp. JR4.1]|uniref:Nmad2 family putative nucleotide modification protein n=1 Tax=Bradyrhizobium sp. JR4.1 TaxID=3156372 RepID=UPI0033937713
MELYSYVVARDFGFAPNPFMNVCTLATCKPKIRANAQVGDWIVGTGTAKRKRSGRLVFALVVSETMTFNEYWNDPRFQCKKPNLRGSKKQAFGDNIYHKLPGKPWQQVNSHHSFSDGTCNPANVKNDTQANRILVAHDFTYWGGVGPRIPARFRNFHGFDICAKRGHKRYFPNDMICEFIEWIGSTGEHGYVSEPLDWDKTQ